ncbi:MAG: type II toxin-antitoxin system VapC family toxin [Verrucomicrobia subdivision 3 bacterium]|nr:type II toxin-antitoxin system VapC family toxin [Limisphaerales bacterium]
MTYLLDTGVWYRGIVAPETIPSGVRELLSDRKQTFGLSCISLWEIGKKVQLGKLRLTKDLGRWLDEAVSSQITVHQIDPAVVTEAMRLPAFPNRDPADELIVATARVHGLTLLTTDHALKNYGHARIQYFKPIQIG